VLREEEYLSPTAKRGSGGIFGNRMRVVSMIIVQATRDPGRSPKARHHMFIGGPLPMDLAAKPNN